MPREKLNNTLENLFDFYHGHSNAAQQQDEGIRVLRFINEGRDEERREEKPVFDICTLQEASHYAGETLLP